MIKNIFLTAIAVITMAFTASADTFQICGTAANGAGICLTIDTDNQLNDSEFLGNVAAVGSTSKVEYCGVSMRSDKSIVARFEDGSTLTWTKSYGDIYYVNIAGQSIRCTLTRA